MLYSLYLLAILGVYASNQYALLCGIFCPLPSYNIFALFVDFWYIVRSSSEDDHPEDGSGIGVLNVSGLPLLKEDIEVIANVSYVNK